jgi:F0F1-type ATP synthase assembly protein I
MRTGITTHRGSILSDILAFSAWGFVIVAGSLLFFWAGILIDEQLRTEPYFMFGLFFLAILLTIGRLWQKAFEMKERLKKVGLVPENERKALRDLSNTGISLGRRH